MAAAGKWTATASATARGARDKGKVAGAGSDTRAAVAAAGSHGSAVSGMDRASNNDTAAGADRTTRSAAGALMARATHEASSAVPVPGAAAVDADATGSTPFLTPL